MLTSWWMLEENILGRRSRRDLTGENGTETKRVGELLFRSTHSTFWRLLELSASEAGDGEIDQQQP